MENIEFISAANLPTTEAEEVDVLCVENGEMKRKAGASLGGGAPLTFYAQWDDDLEVYFAYRDDTLAELVPYAEAKAAALTGKLYTDWSGTDDDGAYYAKTICSGGAWYDDTFRFYFWDWDSYIFFAETVDALASTVSTLALGDELEVNEQGKNPYPPRS